MLPELLQGDGLVLRRWRVADAEIQAQAVAESLDHLRPWMPWIADEPQSPARRRRMLAEWERDWEQGGDVYLAIVWHDRVAGSTGLHRRRGPRTLEIGYWVHPALLRRGIATSAARLLTDAAFTVPGIDWVEIRHDRANVASGAVPRHLGYTLVGETPEAPAAPADMGVHCIWRLSRAAYAARGS